MKNKVKNADIVITAINRMINVLPNYGGSAETERAYYDFRRDMFDMFDKRRLIFNEEDYIEIGKSIVNSIKEQHKKW